VKVGDLVTYNSEQHWAEGLNIVGLVIDVGVFAGNKDVKVMWNSRSPASVSTTYKSEYLEVISESR
jgi:hypothetical protein